MNKPTPIDHKTLPFEQKDAVPCWRYNAYRAVDIVPDGCVSQVWVTRHILYRAKPDKKDYTSGSRDLGVLYETEADAWAACLIEVQENHDERMKKLKEIAAKRGVVL